MSVVESISVAPLVASETDGVLRAPSAEQLLIMEAARRHAETRPTDSAELRAADRKNACTIVANFHRLKVVDTALSHEETVVPAMTGFGSLDLVRAKYSVDKGLCADGADTMILAEEAISTATAIAQIPNQLRNEYVTIQI